MPNYRKASLLKIFVKPEAWLIKKFGVAADAERKQLIIDDLCQ